MTGVECCVEIIGASLTNKKNVLRYSNSLGVYSAI